MGKKVIKTRNAGTMSESAFWGFIRSALRKKSMYWKPIYDCKRNAKREYVGSNKRQKFEYQCNKCKNWFPDKETVIDHITPAGELNKANDLPGFVERLFVEESGLQCLCQNCHNEKTKQEKEQLKIKRNGDIK